MTTTVFPPLADELRLVRDNLTKRGWTRETFEDDRGRVCAHGAVRTCEGLRPGDSQIISALMQRQGLSFEWNDNEATEAAEVAAAIVGVDTSDAALAECFGPQWRQIVWLVRAAAALTPEEARRLDAARDAARAAARNAARAAASAAARDAARGAAWDAARGAAAARDAAWDAARAAASALVVADLVGQHSLTQEHVDLLLALWIEALGPIGEAESTGPAAASQDTVQ